MVGKRRVIPRAEVMRIAEEGLPDEPAVAARKRAAKRPKLDVASRVAAIDLDSL